MLSKSHLILIDLLIVWVAVICYLIFPFDQLRIDVNNDWYFNDHISKYIIILMGFFYIPFSIWNIRGKNHVFETRIGRLIFDKKSRKKELLIYLLKLFFIPSMLSLTIQNGMIMIEHIVLIFNTEHISIYELYCKHLYPLIIYAVLFICTGLYTFGYIVESKIFNNEIISVDTTFIGWFVTLICYYPFYIILSLYLPMMTNNFAFFINDSITLLVWALMIVLFLFKLWCVLSLGWKCSNLTNRGIIINGPYKWIRHPHYAVKILIWWITFIPIFFNDPIYISGMIFWTFIYYLRAITEENHLKKDDNYIEYLQNVKYRFIPGIL